MTGLRLKKLELKKKIDEILFFNFYIILLDFLVVKSFINIL